MNTLTERTAKIAARARAVAETGESLKTVDAGEPPGSGFPQRTAWTVYRWRGEPPLNVHVYPPMTQPEVRATFYPDAAGIIPFAA